MIEYTSAAEYLVSLPDLKTKIEGVDAIITAYTTALLNGALSANQQEFWLDDGQSKIKNIYRSPNEIMGILNLLEKWKATLIVQYNNQKNGRVYRLSDSKNFLNTINFNY